ncbi:MAG: RimK/LysX family protein [Candidatus Moranbacteria bacterium]|nr:RimK/LysX family protein [Candidatus Moranbacteria bacterium]
MFELFLKSQKLLGMNARNLDYVRPLNRKKAMRIADDKLLCKRILRKQNLSVPKLLGKIKNYEELDAFDWSTLPGGFALKPNRGFGGGGILVVYARKRGRDDAWVKADGSLITIEDLKIHIKNILDGSFSLSNLPDTAFFEERLTLLKLFKPYSYKGIPDIRVIVFNSVPVMAMLRLPTRASDGKANLQQGAIGVGIDLATGTTTSAIMGKGNIIEYVPDTNLVLSGIKLPYWKETLRIAVEAQKISGLGFLGADIALDRERGPVIIELNARPGLSIQLANLSGLRERLDRVKGIKIKTTDRGIRVGMNLFGGEIEDEIEEISGKKMIGVIEKVTFFGKDNKEITLEAKIDTGADSSSIDFEVAEALGFGETVRAYRALQADWEKLKNLTKEERWELFENIPDAVSTVPIHSSHGTTYRVKIQLEMLLDGTRTPIRPTLIDRSRLDYKSIIGRKNLLKFLVDVSK